MKHQLLSPETISTSSSTCTSPLDSPDNFEKSLNKYTSNQIAKAEEFEEKAGKKINGWWSVLFGWSIFGSSYKYAAKLYEKAADCYTLSKSWDKMAEMYLKAAGCYLKLENTDFKHKAGMAYVHAGHIYRNNSAKDAISCYNQAVYEFLEIGSFHSAGLYCEEIGEVYEVEQNIEKAILYFERAADLYLKEESSTSTDWWERCNQCKQKIAQFSAQLEQYPKAIAIYEDFAKRSSESSATGYLLNAGLCQLCKADAVAISNALKRYEELDPTFPGTREYKFLADLAASVDEEDVQKFTDVVEKFCSVTKQDAWKTTLLMRMEEKLKAKKMTTTEEKLKAIMEKVI
ncbi:hypothetical protein MKW92_048276 [Papaver armeniacum]|nr:hypothetical protein MKW92_048276 [Papaver armeniacum]